MKQSFTDQLTRCECCPRKCGVNRLEGKRGFCGIRSGIEAPRPPQADLRRTGNALAVWVQVAHAGLHFGEEPPISGTKGSGAVFFAGCNLRCVFCQNYQISQEYHRRRTATLTTDALVSEILRLQDQGAHNINFVSPSHVIFQMADAVQAARAKGLAVPVVYNSNGYDSVDALRKIRGLVDIYLPDIKYMENEPGRRFSKVDDYADIVPWVLREMLDQVGNLKMDADGIAVRGLLVRHLVLPGHTGNSRKCLRFLSGLSGDIHVSIMSQYSPQYKACDYPKINRALTQDEYDEITDYALDLGLENAFIQEPGSEASPRLRAGLPGKEVNHFLKAPLDPVLTHGACGERAGHDHYLPDFDLDRPFKNAKD